MTTSVVPKINDAYWFDYSENILNGAHKRRDDSAALIQKLVVWLWGIYTASAAIGFALSGKELTFWPAFIIASASGALILVYWGTVWVQMPVQIAFDPRVPKQIKQAYNKSVRIKSRRLNITLFGSVVAAIMVSIALIVASVSKPVKHDYSDIQTTIDTIDGKSVLSVLAWVGETKKVTVTASELLKNDEQGEKVKAVILPTKQGLLQTSMTFNKESINHMHVQLQWTSNKGNEINISKNIKKTN